MRSSIVPSATRSSPVSGRPEKRRIVSAGPSSDRGGMTTLTRDPSGSRASTIGLASSTRRPSGARMRSMTWSRCASSWKRACAGAMRPARSTNTLRRAADHHLGDRGVAQERLERARARAPRRGRPRPGPPGPRRSGSSAPRRACPRGSRPGPPAPCARPPTRGSPRGPRAQVLDEGGIRRRALIRGPPPGARRPPRGGPGRPRGHRPAPSSAASRAAQGSSATTDAPTARPRARAPSSPRPGPSLDHQRAPRVGAGGGQGGDQAPGPPRGRQRRRTATRTLTRRAAARSAARSQPAPASTTTRPPAPPSVGRGVDEARHRGRVPGTRRARRRRGEHQADARRVLVRGTPQLRPVELVDHRGQVREAARGGEVPRAAQVAAHEIELDQPRRRAAARPAQRERAGQQTRAAAPARADDDRGALGPHAGHGAATSRGPPSPTSS